MFNPKGNNLLDEQLSVSGLEMNWLGAVIGGVTSIASGIMGHQAAKSQNADARKAEKEQRKHQKALARLTNDYNRKLDGADKANYYAMREYSYETSLKNWQRGAEIQDYQYLQRLKEWQKSTAIGNAQLGLNAQGEALGIQAEADAINEAFIQQQFQYQQVASALKQTYVEQNINQQEQFQQLAGIRNRKDFGNLAFQNTVDQLMTQGALAKESEMVKNLVSSGAIQASAQAGKSAAKAQQSNMAELHRGLMALDSELSGKYKQAAVQMAQLNADSSLQEAGVGLNLRRIDQAIINAESEAQGNLEVMRANMKSTINQTLRNVKQIALERQVADVNTRAGMMLFPERLSYDPVPEMPPERVFVERMEAIPGYVPPAKQLNTWAPLISGIGQGAAAIVGADFSKPWHGRG